MDPNGRLHMPNGFVGESFEETGVLKKSPLVSEDRPQNRKDRRVQEAIERHEAKLRELLAK